MAVSLVGAIPKHTIAHAAVSYANLGLSVLPWKYTTKDGEKPNKTPCRAWQVDLVPPMTIDAVRRWWTVHPDHNVGVITGPTGPTDRNGAATVRSVDVVGLDLDTPRALAWAELNLPDTPWKTTTGRVGGGQHWVYRYPTNLPSGRWIASRADMAGVKGLDIRGKGGYLGMPPSVHASQALYQWQEEIPTDITMLPVLQLGWFPCNLLNNEAGFTQDEQPDAPEHCIAAAADWLRTAAVAVEGDGGDRQTFFVACRLRRGFALSLRQATEVIAPWNARCLGPWPDDKLERKLCDAYSKGDEIIGSATGGSAIDRLVARGARHEQPASVTAAAALTLEQARLFCLELPGRATRDVGLPYTEEATAAATLLRQKDMPSFARLRDELKAVHIPIRDWEKHVTVTARAAVTTKLEYSYGKRTRIVVTGDEKQLIDDIIDVLAKSPPIYHYGEELVHIHGNSITTLARGSMRNAILQVCAPVKAIPNNDTGEILFAPTTLPMNTSEMIDSALPEQLTGFRRVRRVSRGPFCAPNLDGLGHRLVLHPTYDADTQTLLSEAPTIKSDLFPTAREAYNYLHWVFSDFPFESETDWTNYLGALVQIVVRPSIQGPTPMYVIEASQERGGKSLLGKVLLILSGLDPPPQTTFPEKAEMIPQAVFATVRAARPAHVWDNAAGIIDSPDMASVLTSTMFGGRILHTSDTQMLPCEQLWAITSNNAQLSSELAKRSVRIRLVTSQGMVQRAFKIPDLLAYVSIKRGDILSAVCRLVEHWIAAGSPKCPQGIWMEGYEPWIQTIGGIMHACGIDSWLNERAKAVKTLSAHADWEPFCNAWWDKHGPKLVTTTTLWGICATTGLLGSVLGDKSDHAQQTKLGMVLRKQHQAYHGDFQLIAEEQRANSTMYRLVAVNNVRSLTSQTKTATI